MLFVNLWPGLALMRPADNMFLLQKHSLFICIFSIVCRDDSRKLAWKTVRCLMEEIMKPKSTRKRKYLETWCVYWLELLMWEKNTTQKWAICHLWMELFTLLSWIISIVFIILRHLSALCNFYLSDSQLLLSLKEEFFLPQKLPFKM